MTRRPPTRWRCPRCGQTVTTRLSVTYAPTCTCGWKFGRRVTVMVKVPPADEGET